MSEQKLASQNVAPVDSPQFRGHKAAEQAAHEDARDSMQSRSAGEFTALYQRLLPECESIIAQYPDSRSALLPIVHRFQAEEGYVSKSAMNACAEMLNLPPAVIESTVSFYTLFFRRPVGRYMLQVCRNLSCSMNGADGIMAYFREQLGITHLQTSDDGLFSYEEVECLAACNRAPCMQVNLEFVYDLTPQAVDSMLAAMRRGNFNVAPLPQTAAPGRTWIESQNATVAGGKKSPGAQQVVDADNAGGIGDASGVIMLDRILADKESYRGRSRERLLNEPDHDAPKAVLD
ncbi:MAG: NAD(P)H-dependent oxidoreductase subunit E [Candidatus Eremiobacteraeota bacterium]|nr:NAD(P)H-dependent oxidoreductase subunit E [Candidatus Eremiobacteraeota bacterium]